MKKIITGSILILVCLSLSCNEAELTNSSALRKYPTKLNMEWEYNTHMIIEFYDDFGNVRETDTTDFGNTVTKIINLNDSLGSYKDLIKFMTYDLLTPNQIGYNWYANPDSGLISIAYTSAGSSQPILPKTSTKRYLTLDELLSIIKSPVPDFLNYSTLQPIDSIYYYETPRQSLAYPLTINKRWVEMVYPWYRERYVEKIVSKFFQGSPLKCYVIKIYWNYFEIELNDYVSLEKGLIRREILADSVIITDPSHPDSGGFGRFYEYFNLIRFNQ